MLFAVLSYFLAIAASYAQEQDEFDVTIEEEKQILFDRGGVGTYGTALSKIASFVSLNGFANNEFIATEDESSFDQSEINLFVSAELSKRITTEFNVGFSFTEVEIEYAFLDYEFDPRAVLRVGKFLLPTSDFNEYNGFAYLNRGIGSPLTALVSPDKWSSVGLQLRGKFGDNDSDLRPYYGVYIVNGLATPGEGEEEEEEEEGELRELVEGGEVTDNNQNKGIGGQIGIEYKKDLFASLSYHTSKYDSADQLNANVFGISTGYDNGKLHLSAEFHSTLLEERDGEEIEEEDMNGFFVTAAYKVNKFEPVLRYDSFSLENTSIDRVTVGFNYYFLETGLLKVNYMNQSGDTDDENVFGAGVVFTF